MSDAAPARGRSPVASPLRGLLLACHPLPALAVTICAAALAAASGATPVRTALVGLAFLAGQLSIGWSNDWLDASRDRAVARLDKPVAAGTIGRATVGYAALAAVALAVPSSLALGLAAGVAHLVAVASAWSYNLCAKRTALSWLPYAVSFGLLPVVVTLALPRAHVAPMWAICAGALLGIGAHLTNVLPDLDDDARTGVRGLPHRLGRRGSVLVASLLLSVASVLVVLGPGGPAGGVGSAALVIVAALLVVGIVNALRPGRSRIAFHTTIAIAVLDVMLLMGSGPALAVTA